MKKTLNNLFEGKTLTREEAKKLLLDIARLKYNASQMVAFMTAYCMRSIYVEELQGFRDAMLDLCIPVNISEFNTVDVCGTGGDGKDTFNISTLASFVVAGAGYKVAKHGNYGVSSPCGSSNVMENLGLNFTNNIDSIRRNIDKVGICFLHAPLFHPALKTVAPLRKELGVKTFFNMLGPMVNPAFPHNQLVGVFSLELARMYAYLYQQTDKNFIILHSLQGYDEVSLTSPVKLYSNKGEMILEPADFGYELIHPSAINGGETVNQASAIFMRILNGEGTSQQNAVVISNAALAIQTVEQKLSLEECKIKAEESLFGKEALNTFKKLIDMQ